MPEFPKAGRALERVAKGMSVIEDGSLSRLMRITPDHIGFYPDRSTDRFVDDIRIALQET